MYVYDQIVMLSIQMCVYIYVSFGFCFNLCIRISMYIVVVISMLIVGGK